MVKLTPAPTKLMFANIVVACAKDKMLQWTGLQWKTWQLKLGTHAFLAVHSFNTTQYTMLDNIDKRRPASIVRQMVFRKKKADTDVSQHKHKIRLFLLTILNIPKVILIYYCNLKMLRSDWLLTILIANISFS